MAPGTPSPAGPPSRWQRLGTLGLRLLGGLLCLVFLGGGILRFYVSGPRLGQLFAAQLNPRFLGMFTIERIDWRLPLQFEVGGVEILPPAAIGHGDRLFLRALNLRVNPWRLLSGQLVVEQLRIEQVDLQATAPESGQPPAWALAFAPRQPQPQQPPRDGKLPSLPMRIEVKSLELHGLQVLLRSPAGDLRVRDGALQEVNFWGEGQKVGLRGDFSASLSLSKGPLRGLRLPLKLNLRGLAAQASSQGTSRVSLEALSGEVAEHHFRLEGEGCLPAESGAPPICRGSVDLAIDTASPVIQACLPAAVRQALRGKLQVHASTAAHPPKTAGGPASQLFNLKLTGDGLGFAEVRLCSLLAEASLSGNQFTLSQLKLQLAEPAPADSAAPPSMPTCLEAHGSALVGADSNTLLGVHHLSLQLQHLPLRQLMAAAVKFPSALPEHIDLQVQAQGKSLWPLGTTLQLQLTAHGIPLAVLPGVPDPFSLRGQLRARPSAIDLDPIRLQGDGAELLLQGSVPLSAEGLVDLFTHVHHVKPRRILRRLLPSQKSAVGPLGRLGADAGAIDLEARLTGSWKRPRLRGRLQVTDLRLGGPKLQLRLPFVADPQAVEVQGGRLQLPQGKLELSLQLGLQETAPLRVDARLQTVELAALVPDLKGQLSGHLQLGGSRQRPVGQGALQLQGLHWRSLKGAAGSVQIGVDGRQLALRQLQIHDAAGAQLSAAGTYQLASQQLRVSARLLGLPVQQVAEALGPAADSATDAEAPRRLGGALTGHAELSGQLGEPRLEGQMCWQQARFAALSLGEVCARIHGSEARWNADVDVDGASELSLRLRARQHPGSGPQGELTGQVALQPLSEALQLPIDLPGHASLQARWRTVGGAPELTAEIDSEVLQLAGCASGNGQAGKARLDRLRLASGPEALRLQQPATLMWGAHGVSLAELNLLGEANSLHLQAQLRRPTPAPSPRPAELQLALDARLGLPLLAQWLTGLGSADGTLGVHAALQGPIDRLRGKAQLAVATPWSLRPRTGVGEVQLARGAIDWQPGRLCLTGLTGSIGTGSFAGDGCVRLDRHSQQPQHYDLRLRGQAIPWRSDSLLLEGNFALAALGEGPYPRLAGSVDLTAGRLRQRFTLKDFAFVAIAPPASSVPLNQRLPALAHIPLDIRVRSQGDLGVSVDAGAFALKLDLGANLHVGGTAALPRPEGKLAASSGSLRFPRSTLEIREAVVDLVPSRRGKVDAAVRLAAAGEVVPRSTSRNPDPQPYQVDLQLEGNHDKLALEARSSPELARLDVLALLATGYANLQDIAGGGGDASALDAALAFAGAQATEPLARFAEAQIERALNLQVELGAEVADDSLRVTAAKQMHPRLRVEGSYERGLGSQAGGAVGTRARLSLTDRLLLEGASQQSLDTSSLGLQGAQSSLQLRYRLLDR
jgi:hypothetical protein